MNRKSNKLYKLIRIRGCIETLSVLEFYHENGITQKDFVKELEKRGSYPNSFYRIKDRLLTLDLIKYDLNKENKIVLLITSKGKDFMTHIHELESLIEEKKG